MKMKYSFIERSKLANFVRTLGGKMFSLEFTKKNGERRTMTARIGVERHRRTKTAISPAHKFDNPYMLVFDMHKKGYRMVNLNTVGWVKCGEVYFVK